MCVAKESIQVVGLCSGIGVEYCDSCVRGIAMILEFASHLGVVPNSLSRDSECREL